MSDSILAALRIYEQRTRFSNMTGKEFLEDFLSFLKQMGIELVEVKK